MLQSVDTNDLITVFTNVNIAYTKWLVGRIENFIHHRISKCQAFSIWMSTAANHITGFHETTTMIATICINHEVMTVRMSHQSDIHQYIIVILKNSQQYSYKHADHKKNAI